MTAVFVAEIGGRALIALNAEGEAQAMAVLEEPGVRLDLQGFHSGGQALWNGVDELRLRAPEPHEEALWQASFEKAVTDSGASYEDALCETWICVLVAVSAT